MPDDTENFLIPWGMHENGQKYAFHAKYSLAPAALMLLIIPVARQGGPTEMPHGFLGFPGG
jgi:hypothetical protein